MWGIVAMSTEMILWAGAPLACRHDLLMAWMNIGPMELAIILVLGVLLFGKRLPEVGRSLGKGIVEFKKGLRGVEEEIDDAVERSNTPHASDRVEVESPKFEIPPQSAADSLDKDDQPV